MQLTSISSFFDSATLLVSQRKRPGYCSNFVNQGTKISTISSPSNPFVKHCVKLRQSSSYRHSSGSAIIIGLNPIREIIRFHELKNFPNLMECLLLLEDVQIPEEFEKSPVNIIHVSPIIMKKVSGVQSVDATVAIALMKFPITYHTLNGNQGKVDYEKRFPFHHRVLVLDEIQDPGNLGTLLRSAVSFRWDGVFLLPGCCDPFNDKALRASRGASFQIPIVSGNWAHLSSLSNKFHMKMLAGHPESSEEVNLLSLKYADSLKDIPICLVLGSEGQGLSEFSKESCELISIPMAGNFESLNVSVAGGIFLYMLQPESHKRTINCF